MSGNKWVAYTTDYSKKYSVSISTLRRRIKGQAADFHLIDGKYYLVDLPLDNHVQSASEKKMDRPHTNLAFKTAPQRSPQVRQYQSAPE